MSCDVKRRCVTIAIVKRMKKNWVKRNPERLRGFYEELIRMHRQYHPDIRFGQLMCTFFHWVQEVKGRDTFYVEEADMLEYLHEYIERDIYEEYIK